MIVASSERHRVANWTEHRHTAARDFAIPKLAPLVVTPAPDLAVARQCQAVTRTGCQCDHTIEIAHLDGQ
jgi:hypothetical protein